MKEMVLGFPAKELENIGWTSTTGFDKGFEYRKLLKNNRLYFMDREKAETDPSFKQLIPYCLLSRTTDDKIFTYRRTKKVGEQRLAGKRSIGIGGHINPIDSVDGEADWYYEGALREIKEEVNIVGDILNTHIVGYIYDDSSEVGQVHFGVVHSVLVRGDVSLKEDILENGEFLSWAEMLTIIEDFENWSQILIREMNEV